ncbi:hypothetical protein M422DRAFT_253317 [Sphaerobolus stellatus SS14]|uniref:Uncharacterized protein n=1 Tax=Sphaerobolus stellatus (strain SS14) TaxID=990650 RepID=A0A0C9V8Y8_SPHS4|nr:hypothetical protein M422DRAFT_253317 [Sphaerobolus stellatus SS14]
MSYLDFCLSRAVSILVLLHLALLMVVWFAASADDNFQTIGARTKIPYFDDFELYLRLITEGLQLKKKFAIGLIEEWNQELYPNTYSGNPNGSMSGKNNERPDSLKFIDEDLLEASGQEEEQEDEGNNSAIEDNEEMNGGDGEEAGIEEEEDTMCYVLVSRSDFGLRI